MTLQFVVGPPLRDDASYVPRQADRVFDELMAQGRWTSVIGPPRLGKSSLLLRGARRARAMGHRAAYVSLNAYSTRDPVRWATSVLAEIQLKLSGDERESPTLTAPEDLRAWVLATLRSMATDWDTPVTLLLDEVGELSVLPPDAVRDIVEAINVVQSEEDQRGRLTLVIAGVIDPRDLRPTMKSSWLAFEQLHLGDFRDDEIAPLRETLRASVDDGDAWMSAILAWTSGHPYFTQWCASEVSSGSRLPAGASPAERLASLIRRELLGEAAPPSNLLVSIGQELRQRVPDPGAYLDVLDLYRQLLHGAAITVDWDDERHRWLRVLGLARLAGERRDERLTLRNRIVREFYDEPWLRAEIARLDRPFAEEALSSARGGDIKRELSMAGLRARIRWLRAQGDKLSSAEQRYLFLLTEMHTSRVRWRVRAAVAGALIALSLATRQLVTGWRRSAALREQNARAQQARAMLSSVAADDLVQRIAVLDEYVEKLAGLDRDQAHRSGDAITLASGHFDAHMELLVELRDLLPRLRSTAALRPQLDVANNLILSLQASLRACDPLTSQGVSSLVQARDACMTAQGICSAELDRCRASLASCARPAATAPDAQPPRNADPRRAPSSLPRLRSSQRPNGAATAE